METNKSPNQTTRDPVLSFLNRVIALVARILAVIMVLIIIWGIADVIYVLYQRLMAPPFLLLEIKDILATFGAFMAVLIAIEIYHNIILYAEDTHNRHLAVEIVLGTALMAIARKVIVLDFNEVSAAHIYGTAAITLALALGYYLIVVRERGPKS
ncbi:phosphate-starvation-inducible PsiE family protein [Noviherbaspirillum agri]